jgi:phosphoribosyl-AMP cyclohydrolase
MKAKVRFNHDGLCPAVVQDATTREVLMVAYMNEESLRLTLETGEMHYWSRSRRKIWHKGESSGHLQRVKEMRVDCDMDSLLFLVDQTGGACHEGYSSCFFRTLDPSLEMKVVGDKVFEPGEVYRKES